LGAISAGRSPNRAAASRDTCGIVSVIAQPVLSKIPFRSSDF
jgi:hypothetical protein